MSLSRGERLLIALFIGMAAGSLVLVTGAMLLAAFGAVATLPAHGYRVGTLLAGIPSLLVGSLVARWAYGWRDR